MNTATRLALKVDVDTEVGTREGVPALQELFASLGLPACFLFSLGPDQTGRAVTRLFRPGFFRKVQRTQVLKHYGLRTLLQGTLLPAPCIGRRQEEVLRSVARAGFEVGIHCYNHYQWQDYLASWTLERVRSEFGAAQKEFERVFGFRSKCAGAPGWQSTAFSRQVYSEAGLLYSSDTRGSHPYYPVLGTQVFSMLEIPTTLPTLDECLGRPGFEAQRIPPHLLNCFRPGLLNVYTLHAELEGRPHLALFREFLKGALRKGVEVVSLEAEAIQIINNKNVIDRCQQIDAALEGRSGTVAFQGKGLSVGS